MFKFGFSGNGLWKPDGKFKSLAVSAICFVAVITALVFGSGPLMDLFNPKIIHGVSVAGTDLSGMTRQQAADRLQVESEKLAGKILTLNYDEQKQQVPVNQLINKIDLEKTVDKAYSQGRANNIFSRIARTMAVASNGAGVGYAVAENKAQMDYAISDVSKIIDQELVNASYIITENILQINAGTDGRAVDKDGLYRQMLSELSSYDDGVVEVPVKVTKAQLDMEMIKQKVIKEPKDAVVDFNDDGTFVIGDEVNGQDFDFHKAEGEIEVGSGKLYKYTLSVTVPLKTKRVLQATLFRDNLASRKTTLNTGEVDRTHNVQLAASLLNGAVILPGETFSFNKRVGQRTEERGFRMAKIYSQGEIVDGLGGGLCQVSSTLYSALLRTNFVIAERKNHVFTVGYIPLGEDATLYWGSIDFKFKNTTSSPVKILAEQKSNYLKIDVLGTAEKNFDKQTIIKIINETVSTTPYKTIQSTDETLKAGTQKVVQKGSNGSVVKTYKAFLDAAGKEISRVYVGTSTYKPANRIVKIGPPSKTTGGTPQEDAPKGDDTQSPPAQPTPPAENGTPPDASDPPSETAPAQDENNQSGSGSTPSEGGGLPDSTNETGGVSAGFSTQPAN